LQRLIDLCSIRADAGVERPSPWLPLALMMEW
jgi:hypothetical protein